MEKTIEGRECLDYLRKTLERGRNFRAACLNNRVLTVAEENLIVGKKLIAGRTGLQ